MTIASGDHRRWESVERLFTTALEQPPAGRMDWARANIADAEVRAEVEAMLANLKVAK